MPPRRHQRRVGLDVRMLVAMALLCLVYAGIGCGMHLLGVPVWAIAVLAGVCWLGSGLGPNGSPWPPPAPARSPRSRCQPCIRRWCGCAP